MAKQGYHLLISKLICKISDFNLLIDRMKLLIKIVESASIRISRKYMWNIHKAVPVLSTELPANFTCAFCQNNDYERPGSSWFSLEKSRDSVCTCAANVFFALLEVMICNFADAKGKRSIIFRLREAK